MDGLWLSLTDTNKVTWSGSSTPPTSWDWRKEIGKTDEIPITSTVNFIYGERTGSIHGKRANGNTASLPATCGTSRRIGMKLASGSPAITRAAILAIGTPIALATNGTVRLARGLTSIR